MSATITPIDAEGNEVEYGTLYIGPSGDIYEIRRQAFSTAQMVDGYQHQRRRGAWKTSDQRYKLLAADVMIPFSEDQLAAMSSGYTQYDAREVYSKLYRNGPAHDRTRGHIAEHKRQVAAVRAKMLGGE